MAQVVECLPRKCAALSSNTSTKKKKKRRRKQIIGEKLIIHKFIAKKVVKVR
jgi:hypothetical protein